MAKGRYVTTHNNLNLDKTEGNFNNLIPFAVYECSILDDAPIYIYTTPKDIIDAKEIWGDVGGGKGKIICQFYVYRTDTKLWVDFIPFSSEDGLVAPGLNIDYDNPSTKEALNNIFNEGFSDRQYEMAEGTLVFSEFNNEIFEFQRYTSLRGKVYAVCKWGNFYEIDSMRIEKYAKKSNRKTQKLL